MRHETATAWCTKQTPPQPPPRRGSPRRTVIATWILPRPIEDSPNSLRSRVAVMVMLAHMGSQSHLPLIPRVLSFLFDDLSFRRRPNQVVTPQHLVVSLVAKRRIDGTPHLPYGASGQQSPAEDTMRPPRAALDVQLQQLPNVPLLVVSAATTSHFRKRQLLF